MPEKPPPVALPFSGPFLEAIGGVITAWAALETDFDHLIALLALDVNVAALARPVPRPFNKRQGYFVEAANTAFPTSPPIRKRLAQLANNAKRLRDRRDLMAHGQWSFTEHADRLIAFTIKGMVDVEINEEEFTLIKLRRLCGEIQILHGEIIAFIYPPNEHYFSAGELSALLDFRRRNPDPRAI